MKNKTYLVGGAVRDMLLGLEPKDLDYVVVGSNHSEMIENGFTCVGGHFPVYLHPITKDEYALARTEKSTGNSYQDFEVSCENVTLEEDLGRRDLTINAIAYKAPYFFDPYNGQQDLENKVLKHVSDAFIEDPVRILRVARFHARYGEEWSVHPSTIELCKQNAYKLNSLPSMRIAAEFIKAFKENHTELFISFLHEVGVEANCVKILTSMFKCEQNPIHHPEGNVGIHTLRAVKYVQQVKCAMTEKTANLVKWGVFFHDFGKPSALQHNEGKHYGNHESLGVPVITEWHKEVRLPNEHINFGILCSRYHTHIHKLLELKPKTIYNMVSKVSSENLERILIVSAIDSASRFEPEEAAMNYESYIEKRSEYLKTVITICANKKPFVEAAIKSGKTGAKIGEFIRQKQIETLTAFKKEFVKTV